MFFACSLPVLLRKASRRKSQAVSEKRPDALYQREHSVLLELCILCFIPAFSKPLEISRMDIDTYPATSSTSAYPLNPFFPELRPVVAMFEGYLALPGDAFYLEVCS
jgi:hypothetical protein